MSREDASDGKLTKKKDEKEVRNKGEIKDHPESCSGYRQLIMIFQTQKFIKDEDTQNGVSRMQNVRNQESLLNHRKIKDQSIQIAVTQPNLSRETLSVAPQPPQLVKSRQRTDHTISSRRDTGTVGRGGTVGLR